MTEPSFTIAGSIEEALMAMAAGAKPVAGGTDLVVAARQGKQPLPSSLVAIDRITAMSRIEAGDRELRIGSVVTHARLMTDQTVVSHCTALADGAALVGSPATRNLGTIGGNVMNASPAMDTGAPLVVLDASVELRTIDSVRTVQVTDLWEGPGKTASRSDELCTAIIVPARPAGSGSAYVRLEYRRAMEIAVVGAAASVTLSPDGTIDQLRVALTAVGPTILPLTGLSDLSGRGVDERLLDAIQTTASEQATPISDLRAGERYRRHTVGVMAKRAVSAATTRARGRPLAVPVNRAMGIGAAR